MRHSLQADIIEATQCLRMCMIMDRKTAGTWKKSRWTTPYELYNDIETPVVDLTKGTLNGGI